MLNRSIKSTETICSISSKLDVNHRKLLNVILLYLERYISNISNELKPFFNGFFRIIFNDAITEQQRANQLIYFLDNEYKTEYNHFFNEFQ
jgi:hypothetical protein